MQIQYFINPASGYNGPRQDDEESTHEQEPNHNLHSIGHKDDHITEEWETLLQSSLLNQISTNPVNRQCQTARNPHHNWIHHGHQTTDEKIESGYFIIGRRKLLILIILSIVSPDHANPSQTLSSDTV